MPTQAQTLATAGENAPLTAPEIEFTQWTLDNGLRVIAIQDDSTATVTTSLWYEVGSKLDPDRRSGFAHLFEHILSRKTLNMPYNMIYGLTADVGGTRNASTGDDRTNYYEQVPAQYLETMLWTHRERMAFPVIDEQVFESERDVVKEELRTRMLAPPYGRLSRQVLPEIAYDVLPQRRSTIGSLADLDLATLDDARAFHQAYYGPDTATLIVAGNFDMASLRSLVDRYFADIPPRANPLDVTITARAERRTQPRTAAAYAPGVPLPLIGTVWQGPERAHPDSAALEVLSAIMGRGQNSRFNASLIRTGKAVQAERLLDFNEEGGMLGYYAVLNPAADMDEVAGIMAAEAESFRTGLVSDAELAEAKNELISDSLRARETASGRAFELGEALVSTGDPRAADLRLRAIAAVTPQDVQRAARVWLAPEARVDLTYQSGEDNPATYANPVPMPAFRILPPAVGQPLAVLPEGERQAPPAPGPVPVVSVPQFVRHDLANGMEVIAAQTGDVPLATMTVLVPGGSKSDPRAKAGLADFAAGLASRGTATRSAEEIAAALESLGADFGASARSDGTVFTLTAPTANLPAAGEIFADIIRNASFPQDELERELARTMDGLRIALSDPGSLAGMAVRPLIYGDAPYGNVTSGIPASLAALTREDLAAHRTQYWHPAASQVVVSGGIAPTEAFALTQHLFGDWQAEAPPPAAVDDPAGPSVPVRTVVIDMPEAGQAAVVLAGRGPAQGEPSYYPLALANAVLGGGSSGRLFEEIRTRRSLSYGASSSLGSLADEPLLTASSQTANETVDEVVQVMLDEFARIGTQPLEQDLIDRRRLYLTGSHARRMETSAGFSGIVSNLLALGIDPDEAAQYAARLGAVTPQAASAAAQEYFDPDNISVVIVGNAAAFIDDLRAIRPGVEVIPAAELDLSSADLR
ncbi:pitrilysin family protein [Alteraurantiacibacter aestuarii]|uniref:M16 family metallopeptidase n=1 Tax=Alteraurantiacibacter aestuarii TaxID=650004 RepID=UPI001F19B57E|nr:pitrilysin family protein [Alteraurantiacibacter aestuarii]